MVGHIYSYLRLLASAVESGELPQHLLSERTTMSQLAFEFAEQSEPLPLVKAIAGRMHPYQPERLLSSPFEWPAALDANGLEQVATDVGMKKGDTSRQRGQYCRLWATGEGAACDTWHEHDSALLMQDTRASS